jgi:hypothetical protein
MNNSSIIKTKGLSYHYSKDVQTLFDIDLNVEREAFTVFLVRMVPVKQQH